MAHGDRPMVELELEREHARRTVPQAQQLLIDMGPGNVRERMRSVRRIITRVLRENGDTGTLVSASPTTVVYKGFLSSNELGAFWPDLRDPLFTSPLASIKSVGLLSELGLVETHHTLVAKGLRSRVKLRADGGFKTGRDVVIVAMLGADEYGFGSALLVALGCIYARQCHKNTCPVGIASQDPALRAKFKGTAEEAIAFLGFVARDVRRRLAALGARSLDEVHGRNSACTGAQNASRYGRRARTASR